MADDTLRDRIEKALAEVANVPFVGSRQRAQAHAVLAVVDAHTRQAQAQALRDAALQWMSHAQLRRMTLHAATQVTPEEVHDWLLRRADIEGVEPHRRPIGFGQETR